MIINVTAEEARALLHTEVEPNWSAYKVPLCSVITKAKAALDGHEKRTASRVSRIERRIHRLELKGVSND